MNLGMNIGDGEAFDPSFAKVLVRYNRAGHRAQTLTRAEASTQIARRLREWVDIFEAGRLSRPVAVA